MLWEKGTPSTASPCHRALSLGQGGMLQPPDLCPASPPPRHGHLHGQALQAPQRALGGPPERRGEPGCGQPLCRALRRLRGPDGEQAGHGVPGASLLLSHPSMPLQSSPVGPQGPFPSPGHQPHPTPCWGWGVLPSSPWLSGLGAPPAVGTAGACPHGCRQLINVPVEVIYVPVTCSFFFLLPQWFVSKRLSLNQGPAAAWDKGGGGDVVDLAHWGCWEGGWAGCSVPAP